ncbi:MAG: hypothetical protein IT223_03220 [Crocinitomicaceae bacterium]|nr:hypothetical protein [Crocinitomicaceae bacterium]
MLKLIKYYPVNWIDGMKLTREHFQMSENALYDAIRDSSNQRLSSWCFGLLPSVQGVDSSLDYHIDIDRAGLIRVTLKFCRAVTLSGARIEIINIQGQKLHTSIGELNTEFNFLNHNGKNLFVVVDVNPFDRSPFGEPDTSEHPPRFPLTIPTYRLEVIPQDKFTEVGPFHLPIAKLEVQGNAVQVIESYIPPCTSVESHRSLQKLFLETDSFYSSMELFTSTILQKIYQKSQKNPLAEIATYLCEKILTFFSGEVMPHRWTKKELPPVFLFASAASLARIMKNTLEVRSGSGREEFINYLTDWDEFNLQQGEFEALLNDLVLMEYDHLDIANAAVRLRKFQSVMLKVFDKLSKLDYIGKKEDPGIIVAQRTKEDADKKSSGSKGNSIWLE